MIAAESHKISTGHTIQREQSSQKSETYGFTDNRAHFASLKQLVEVAQLSSDRGNQNQQIVQRAVDEQKLRDLTFHSIAKYLDNIPQPQKIIGILKELKADEDNGVDTIMAMSAIQARAMLELLADEEMDGDAAVKWFKAERLTGTAEALEGGLSWTRNKPSADVPHDKVVLSNKGRNKQGEYVTNDFTSWVNGEAESPGDQSKMNCWEAVLYAGYKSGIIPKSFIFAMYESAIAGAQEQAEIALKKAREKEPKATLQNVWPAVVDGYKIAMANALGANNGDPYTLFNGPKIPRGYLVFFDGINHVALSLGKKDDGEMMIMSLWERPLAKIVFQSTTIEEVVGMSNFTVTYGPPPW